MKGGWPKICWRAHLEIFILEPCCSAFCSLTKNCGAYPTFRLYFGQSNILRHNCGFKSSILFFVHSRRDLVEKLSGNASSRANFQVFVTLGKLKHCSKIPLHIHNHYPFQFIGWTYSKSSTPSMQLYPYWLTGYIVPTATQIYTPRFLLISSMTKILTLGVLPLNKNFHS